MVLAVGSCEPNDKSVDRDCEAPTKQGAVAPERSEVPKNKQSTKKYCNPAHCSSLATARLEQRECMGQSHKS